MDGARSKSNRDPNAPAAAPADTDLHREYLPLVIHIAAQIHARLPAPAEFDELVADGLLGLVRAARRYDADHPAGATFTTYAYDYLRGRILTGLHHRHQARGLQRGARRPLSWSLHSPPPGADDGQILADTISDPDSAKALDTIDRRDQIAALLKCVDRRRAAILELFYIKDHGDRQIADLLGVTPGRVSQLRHQALARIRKLARPQETPPRPDAVPNG